MLAGLRVNNPFGYHYEMFNTQESIKEVIKGLIEDRDIRHIYIAAHGDESNIYGPRDKRISRTLLANVLESVDPRKIYGVFFGCCGFGSSLDKLREKGVRISWLAGYSQEVDWLQSSAMDLLFWQAYYESDMPEHRNMEDRFVNMTYLLIRLWFRVPYLFKELGFTVSLVAPQIPNGDSRTFPDEFFDMENGKPQPRYRELIHEVKDSIDQGEPGRF